MEPLDYADDNLDRTEEFLNRLYPGVRVSAAEVGPSPARVRRWETGGLLLDRLKIDFEMRYDVEPLGRICLLSVDRGRFPDHRTASVHDSFGPGDVVSLAEPDRPYCGRLQNADYTLTLLEPEILSQVAQSEDGAEAVRLTGHRPVSPAAGVQLRRTLSYLHELLGRPGGSDPLVVDAAERLAAAVMIAAFPSNARTEPTALDRRDAHPAALRRAIAFVEQNANRDIGVDDIAAAAHVGVRAVQLAFRRHLGCTPMQYLRRVRLDCAHRELLAADPSRTTVGAIASRWGFGNAGRFAAEYRAAHGCSPTQTLRS